MLFTNRIRRRARGLLLACLPLWLCGCATRPVRTETVTVRVPVYVALPASLTATVPLPPFAQHPTNADLADYTLQCVAALHTANDQLRRIRSVQPGH